MAQGESAKASVHSGGRGVSRNGEYCCVKIFSACVWSSVRITLGSNIVVEVLVPSGVMF